MILLEENGQWKLNENSDLKALFPIHDNDELEKSVFLNHPEVTLVYEENSRLHSLLQSIRKICPKPMILNAEYTRASFTA